MKRLPVLAALLVAGCTPGGRPADLSVGITAPSVLKLRQRGYIQVAFENRGEAPIVVRDIDIKRQGLLEAGGELRLRADVERADEVIELRDYLVFRVNLTVEPGATVTVPVVVLPDREWRPAKAVTLNGQIDAALGNFANHTVDVRVTVDPSEPRTGLLGSDAAPAPAGASAPSTPPGAPSEHAGGSRPGRTRSTADRRSPRP